MTPPPRQGPARSNKIRSVNPKPAAAAATPAEATRPRIGAGSLRLSKSQPVGQPPITRWDYPEYRLYFEYDHVLHAVVPDHFEPVTHSDELQPAD